MTPTTPMLDDLRQFAEAAAKAERDAAEYAQRPDSEFSAATYQRLCSAASVAQRVLLEACTPARILSLVESATRRAELDVAFNGPVTFGGMSLPPMQGGCNCYFKAPTVPVYRGNMTHLDDCPAKGSGFSVGALIAVDAPAVPRG